MPERKQRPRADDAASPDRGAESANGGKDPTLLEYDRLARQYDRRWATYVARTTDATIRLLEPAVDERILDIGCGTGALLARLATEGVPGRLAGVDPSTAMLAVARKRLPPGIDLQSARAEALPFADDLFNVAVSCNVFHFVPAPETALAEMRRVVRPGGRVAITDWCHDYLSCRLLDQWLRLTGRGHHRTYRAAELASMLESAGFTDVDSRRYRVDWWWGMMTLTARRSR